MIQSILAERPQPNKQFFGVSDLYLTQRLTRAEYEKAFGEQPPPWDASKPIKRWFDTGILAGSKDPGHEVVTYLLYDDAGAGDMSAASRVKSVTMTKLEASLPNLPGIYSYAKFAWAPTTAKLSNPDGSLTVLSPSGLMSREEALAIAGKIKTDTGLTYNVVLSPQYSSWPWVAVWGTETRRWWTLVKDGVVGTGSGKPGDTFDAGYLMSRMYADGVGAPGRFTYDADTGVLSWTSLVPMPASWDSRPEVGMPIRALKANEVWHDSPFGLQVERVDLRPGGSNPVPGPSDGDLPYLTARFDQVDKAVAQVYAAIVNNK